MSGIFDNSFLYCLHLFETRMVPQKNQRNFFPVKIEIEEKQMCDYR